VILWATNEDIDGYDLRFRSSEASVDQPYLEILWTQPVKSVYYLKDHLGSVRATVNDVGEVVSYDDYDAWGLILNGRSMTAQANLPNKFTGKELDEEAGLGWYYFGARYYDPVIGRWGSVDPILSEASQTFLIDRDIFGFSPYSYVFNNPVIVVDEEGKIGIGAIVGGIVGGASAGIRTFQLLGGDLSLRSVGKIVLATTVGAVTGAAAGEIGDPILGVFGAGLAAGAGESTAQFIATGSINSQDVTKATLTGIVGAGVGKAVLKVIPVQKTLDGLKTIGDIITEGPGTVGENVVAATVATHLASNVELVDPENSSQNSQEKQKQKQEASQRRQNEQEERNR